MKPSNASTDADALQRVKLVHVTTFEESLEAMRIRNACRHFMTRDTSLITEDKQRKWWNHLNLDKNRLYLLFGDSEAVGYGFIHFDPEPWITGALLENFRGKGVGRKLFELILDELRTTTPTHVHLEVLQTNDRAIALYLKLRFYVRKTEGQVITMSRVL